ncbi:hypothetical protein FE697_008385 [Mumia zhuanghuii]|uniref:Uncharacterized protein n=2 Tax=Mumia TaxID=1546255 RepID=A0ABW1QIP0_9ACTN|nr:MULTISPECIES: hypothetical protein [Mumia]KAA1423601.1 hypothetical protein FE697_008385 [Mumia zhuanghuii]
MLDLSKETAEGSRNRLAAKIVLGLVAAGAAIGLLMGFAGASAMRSLGFDSDAMPVPATSAPTTEPTEEPATDEPTTAPTPTTPSATPKKSATFKAAQASVSAGERIEFTGRAPELGSGATLQIQRKDEGGGWSDFPVTAQTRKGGKFSTWIVTGRTGRWDFRAVGEGFSSPVATVEIS